MELKDTTHYMTSSNYKERFIAEYWQAKIRYDKLKKFCDKIETAQLMNSLKYPEPEHDCPLELLRQQQYFMGKYLHVLELRAIIECVNVDDIEIE